MCAKLNLLNKPMNIFNMDETGVSVVHKGEKVVTEMGRKNVWALTSGEKGKTHTIRTCCFCFWVCSSPFLDLPKTENNREPKGRSYCWNCVSL